MRPILTVNPVIGDESFVARFGRMPTELDDPWLRVSTHVGYVARQLRETDTSHLAVAVRARRATLLDALDQYVACGAFPNSETDHGLLPTFLDAGTGVRCAVAHLVETTAGTAAMVALDRDHHNDYIADLATDPRFLAWTADSGLTAAELELVQPSYPPPPPADITYTLAADARVAVAHDTPDTIAAGAVTNDPVHTLGMIDASLGYTAFDRSMIYGKPSIELQGGLGLADHDRAYRGALVLGTMVEMPRNHSVGVSGGIAVDAYGPDIPRAWTVPVSALYRIDLKRTTVEFHGGPQISLGDARGLGWSTGIQLRRRNAMFDHGRAVPRDVMVGLDATHVGDAYFLGLTIGFGNAHARHWWQD